MLVATDIAARGLDIEELPHVVNYELPNVPEDYVHRIGRTGRAAATGEALSLVCVDEHKLLRDIEKLLKKEIPRITTPGYEPDPSIKAEPIQNGRQQRGGGGGRGRGQNQGGAGRSQQPRRQDSGAAKAKPNRAQARGTRWRQSTSAASPAQNHACPVILSGNMPGSATLTGPTDYAIRRPDKVLAPSSGKYTSRCEPPSRTGKKGTSRP